MNAFVRRIPKTVFILCWFVRSVVPSFVRLFIWFLYSLSDTHAQSSVWLWRSVHLMCYQYKWTSIHNKGIIIVYSLCLWFASTASISISLNRSCSSAKTDALLFAARLYLLFVFFSFRFRSTHAHCVTSNAFNFLNINTTSRCASNLLSTKVDVRVSVK